MKKDNKKNILTYDISDFNNSLEWIDQLAKPLNENLMMVVWYKSIVRCLIAEQLDANKSNTTTSLVKDDSFLINNIDRLRIFLNEMFIHPDNKNKRNLLNVLKYFIMMLDNDEIGELAYDQDNESVRKIIVRY